MSSIAKSEIHKSSYYELKKKKFIKHIKDKLAIFPPTSKMVGLWSYSILQLWFQTESIPSTSANHSHTTFRQRSKTAGRRQMLDQKDRGDHLKLQ